MTQTLCKECHACKTHEELLAGIAMGFCPFTSFMVSRLIWLRVTASIKSASARPNALAAHLGRADGLVRGEVEDVLRLREHEQVHAHRAHALARALDTSRRARRHK